MDVKISAPREREVTISGSLDELALLYQATRQGRRTKVEQRKLAELGDALIAGDADLAALVAAAEDEETANGNV